MKVAIVGSRKYKPLSDVDKLLRTIAKENPGLHTLVSGGAHGVDARAQLTGKELGMVLCIYKPDWEADGKAAGPKRNSLIVDQCEKLYAFWDGDSKGTWDSIRKAIKASKLEEVYARGDFFYVEEETEDCFHCFRPTRWICGAFGLRVCVSPGLTCYKELEKQYQDDLSGGEGA